MVAGFKVIRLDVKNDERGWLAEILRREELGDRCEFGQFLVTTARPGVIKGNHYHERKREWFCVIKGKGKLVLEGDGFREEIVMGEENMVTVAVPPGVAHALVNVGDEMLYALIYTDEPFDPDDPDTFYKCVA